MNDPVERRLADSLHRHVEHLRSGRDLATAAIDRARRIRSRRRAVAAVAGIALLASAVPFSLNLAGDGGNDRTKMDYALSSPSDSGEPSEPEATRPDTTEELRAPEATEPTEGPSEIVPSTPEPDESGPESTDPESEPTGRPGEATSVTIDFGSLPEGQADPEVPYFDRDAGAIIDGGARTPVELNGIAEVARVAEGYAVQTIEERQRLYFVEQTGAVRPLGSGTATVETYAVNPARDRIAWVEGASGSAERRLVMAQGSGEVIADLPAGTMGVVGFLFDRVAVAGDDGTTPFIWEPGSEPEPVEGGIGALATDGGGYLSVVTGDDEEFRTCSTLLDTGTGNRELWGGCERAIRALEPGGDYAVTVDSRSDGMGDREFEIVDGPTGERFVDVEPAEATYFDYSFEPSGAVLIDAADDGQRAIVRCWPDGECELVTPPRTYDIDAAGDPPYVLGK